MGINRDGDSTNLIRLLRKAATGFRSNRTETGAAARLFRRRQHHSSFSFEFARDFDVPSMVAASQALFRGGRGTTTLLSLDQRNFDQWELGKGKEEGSKTSSKDHLRQRWPT